jgi:hypothetical protein
VAEYFVERANRLRAAQAHWESVRQRASTELLEHANERAADPDARAAADEGQERLRSQVAQALTQLQDLAKELAQLGELLKAEALRKEEQQKTEVLQKEQSDRLEALTKEEQQKQEALAKEEQAKQDALEKAERDKEPPPPEQSPLEFLATIAAEWRYVLDEIAKEWDYVDRQIEQEVAYSVSQTFEVVAEVGAQVGILIADPVTQKEGKEFLQARTQDLAHFIDDELFATAPAAHKAMWLEHKFKEQERALQEAFGDRNDDFKTRELVKEGLADAHGKLLDAVKADQEQEKQLHAELEALKDMRAETAARLEKAGYAPEVLEEKAQQLDAAFKQQEQELRDAATQEQELRWKSLEAELQKAAADKSREMEVQDAKKREEVVEVVVDTYRSL